MTRAISKRSLIHPPPRMDTTLTRTRSRSLVSLGLKHEPHPHSKGSRAGSPGEPAVPRGVWDPLMMPEVVGVQPAGTRGVLGEGRAEFWRPGQNVRP